LVVSGGEAHPGGARGGGRAPRHFFARPDGPGRAAGLTPPVRTAGINPAARRTRSSIGHARPAGRKTTCDESTALTTMPQVRHGGKRGDDRSSSDAGLSTPPAPRRVVVLGSTGSIGTSCLDVIEHLGGRLCALGLSAHRSWEALAEQARRHRPRWVAVTDPEAARALERVPLE